MVGPADYHRVGSGGVAAPEHGPEVARLLHALGDQHQRILRQLQAFKAALLRIHLSDDPFGASSVGDSGIQLLRDFEDPAGGDG